MRLLLRWSVALTLVLPCSADAQLKQYDTKYYVIHSDLDQDTVREAALRVTKMFEVYADRCKGFTGTIRTRLPFYLFRHPDDYYAAGGLPGSAGVFTGHKLMAVAGTQVTSRTWHTIQHEGFHQFVHAVIGGDIPVWVNEGLAEYFGEARFTGDGMVTGLIPPARVVRVKGLIQSGRFKSVPEMMLVSQDDWNLVLNRTDYDQAWSMVHFLAHGDGGRYRSRFDGFLRDVSLKGITWEQAWLRNFDADTDAFETTWRRYWESLPDNPTGHLYAEVTVATLTSFLARAHGQKQSFKDADAFFETARAGQLKTHPRDWLPPRLLQNALTRIELTGQCSLEAKGRKPPKLICTLHDGTSLIGTFTLRKGKVREVKVQAGDRPAKTRKP